VHNSPDRALKIEPISPFRETADCSKSVPTVDVSECRKEVDRRNPPPSGDGVSHGWYTHRFKAYCQRYGLGRQNSPEQRGAADRP